MWPADGTRADGAAPFAALDSANHRLIASRKSAQLLLTARARTPTRASPSGLGKTKQAMEWATGRFREPQRVR